MSSAGALGDRLTGGLLAIAAFAAGVALLCSPAHLDAYDRPGRHISCGCGLMADYGPATAADRGRPHPSATAAQHDVGTDYVGSCHSVLKRRRVWGALAIVAGFKPAMTALRRQRDRSSTTTGL